MNFEKYPFERLNELLSQDIKPNENMNYQF